MQYKLLNLLRLDLDTPECLNGSRLGSEYETFIFHTEVHRLSRGKVLIRVFQPSGESEIFCLKKKHD